MLHVYIGWDKNETEAYRVAERSCIETASQPVCVTPVRAGDLYNWRMFWRPTIDIGGQAFDHLSGAPQATEFATSRFVVPFLQKTGWCLFVDCDVVFLSDIMEVLSYADPKYAVMCVKHHQVPEEVNKMGGLVQTSYGRKNWSSVILWNCDHPANQRLTLNMVNSMPGLFLHQFGWLRDDEIGGLPEEWNWLVNVQDAPPSPKIAHFTLGGPWLQDWEPAEHDDLWLHSKGVYL